MMRSILRSSLVFVFVVGFSMLASADSENRRKGPPTRNVNIVNTPVPVTLSDLPAVEISNQPSVTVVNRPDVAVTNTPDVNVVNTADVRVTNSPDVTVTNAPDVHVVNTPDVVVTNTPNVNVSNTTPIPVTLSNQYQFIGFSSQVLDGSGGIGARHGACQADFGSRARMCNSKEIFESPTIANVHAGQGWVQPFLTAIAIDSQDNIHLVEFNSVVVSNRSLNCASWRASGGDFVGAFFDADYPGGTIAYRSCAAVISVACCTPQ